MKYLRMVLALAVLLTVTSVGAYAATNIYKDAYTTENSSGQWTYTGGIVNSGGLTNSAFYKPNISIIGATPATLTTANAGNIYIIDATAGTTITTITLPSASSTTAKLQYTFISGDGSGIVIRSSDEAAGNILYVVGNSTTLMQARLAEASTSMGTEITARGGSGIWYLTASTPTSVTVETRTDDPQYKG